MTNFTRFGGRLVMLSFGSREYRLPLAIGQSKCFRFNNISIRITAATQARAA